MLRTIFFHVTKACDLRCTYCYFSADRPLPNELTTGEIDRLWPDIVQASPEKLVITGGEPLARRDLVHILTSLAEVAADTSIRRCLNTNGQRMTRAFARDLRGLVHEVRVSIDGFESDNDRSRGHGSHERALAALDMLMEAQVELKVLVTVTASNVAGLGGWLRHLIARGVTRINVNPVRPIGRASSRAEQWLDRRLVDDAIEKAWADLIGRDAARRSVRADADVEQTTCGVGTFVNIMPDGDVFPCHALVQPGFCCGNLRTHKLSEIVGEHGPLARLQQLNFTSLVDGLPAARGLLTAGACLGEVAAVSPDLRRRLPMFDANTTSPAAKFRSS